MNEVTTVQVESRVTGERHPVRIMLLDRSKFQANYSKHGGEPCQYCGRKVGKKDLFVPTLDGADVIHPEDVAWCEANLGIDWPGFYRIGSECAKLLPKGWVHVLPPISQGAA